MIRIINIKTSKYQLSTAIRCLLGALCLVMMGSLQSCRTAAISATAMDLNNYQTGKTIAQEQLAVTSVLAYTPSVISGVSNLSNNGQVGNYISAIPRALTLQVGCELPLTKTWQIGSFMQLSSTTLLDWDAGLRGYIKKELTDSLNPFSTSVLVGASIQWGTVARTKDVVHSTLWGVPEPVIVFNPSRDTIITTTDSEISSQANRVHIALPMSWRVQADSTSVYFASTEYWTDICLTPAIHLIHQNIYLQDSSYSTIWRNRVALTTPTEFAGTRHITTSYIIPSLSVGACFRASVAEIFPEVTIAWIKNVLTFGIGISIRGFLSKK